MSCCNSSEIDDTLFAILKECKTIPNFFDCVFGFLKRKTDFYVVADDPNSPIGLPQGCAEGLTKSSFYKWKNLEFLCNTDETSKSTQAVKPQRTQNTCSKLSSESYNGAEFENYSWSQSIQDVDITVKLPAKTSTKNLRVLINPQNISVKLKSSDEVLISGELCYKIKHTDALWSIDENKLQIHLDKVNEIWWNCLITLEEKLDIAKMDCSRPFEELSQEAQVKIEELTWNQERKRLGLKTSDQIDMENKLKKAWNVKGSPFEGSFNPDSILMD